MQYSCFNTLLAAGLTGLLAMPVVSLAQVPSANAVQLSIHDDLADTPSSDALSVSTLYPVPPDHSSENESHAPPNSPSASVDLTFSTPQIDRTGAVFFPSVTITERFEGIFSNSSSAFSVSIDLYSPPEFKGGLIVVGKDVALKIGGYVKADFIYDFDPIDSTDSFVTTSIPVGAPPRTNTRFHARQTRLSFDTRWAAHEETIRIYVEGDFFSHEDQYRMRHAYGEYGSILVGHTWTAFTDVSAAPPTLDYEGSVSTVSRRQAQARWTSRFFDDALALAVSLEDASFIIEPPDGITGDPRSPSPDLITHIRYEQPWGRFQLAHLFRIGGFQPDNDDVITAPAWGFNFTGAFPVGKKSKVYGQVLFGEGIGSYRDLPDAVPSSATSEQLLGMLGWMVGATRAWTDRLSSNITYAENTLNNPAYQNANDVHRTTYLSANLIWNPIERVNLGIEYLYGIRENVGGEMGAAHRIQTAFIFDLP